jgi:hypothetical protein
MRYLSPIEKQLDSIRDKLWKKAGRNSDAWFNLMREKSKLTLRQYLDSAISKTVKAKKL